MQLNVNVLETTVSVQRSEKLMRQSTFYIPGFTHSRLYDLMYLGFIVISQFHCIVRMQLLWKCRSH